MSDVSELLNVLKSGDSLVFKQKRGALRFQGPDAKDFLQRMSTNNLNKGDAKLASSFTNNKGRMIDHGFIFVKNDDDILVVSSHTNAEVLHKWLLQFHFVEDFTISDVSDETLITIHISKTPFAKNENLSFTFWHGSLDDNPIFFTMLINHEAKDAQIIDEKLFESLRIAALMPTSPSEINENFLPQNISLSSFIAEDKGCYIGQEVIAKAITYQRHKKFLSGALMSLKDFADVKPGMPITSPQNEVGTVTSIAPYYLNNCVNALVITDGEPKNANQIDKETITAKAFQKFT